MKQLKTLVILCFITVSIKAQNENQSVELNQLAVPNSPAFMLVDAASTNLDAPSTPKEFALGMVQNFDVSSKWFQDYSMQFTPYWWVNPAKRNAYNFMGLKRINDTDSLKSQCFSGLKFTDFSLAFLNRDLIADTVSQAQKIISIGVRTTLIRVQQKGYADSVSKYFNDWHKYALLDLEELQNQTFGLSPDSAAKIIANRQSEAELMATKTAKKIAHLTVEKPLFNWDVAGGMAQYGIGDSVWKTGRYGAWTTLSLFIPMDKMRPHVNYFDLLISARFLSDYYSKSEAGIIEQSSILDIGAKTGFEINRFSIFGEFIFRKISATEKLQNRMMALVNFRVKDNIYLMGSYGVDFDPSKKTLSLFGINWGFGDEKINLPSNNDMN